MKDQIIAKAYAKSLVLLSKKNNLDAAKELTSFTEIINENNDFENVLYLDVFTIEEKFDVTKAICEKMKLSSLVKNFILFLLSEKRMGLLPIIFKEIIVLDDHEKGFLRGTIEGKKEDLSNELVSKITSFLEKELGTKVGLTAKPSSSVTAGVRARVEDLQLDATLDNQLKQFKESILDLSLNN